MLSSKAKRAKCSTHKQRVIVMLYNKVCDIVSNISELLEIQLLTDTTILQVKTKNSAGQRCKFIKSKTAFQTRWWFMLFFSFFLFQVSSMGITPFFVENVSELQLCAIKLVTAVSHCFFSLSKMHRNSVYLKTLQLLFWFHLSGIIHLIFVFNNTVLCVHLLMYHFWISLLNKTMLRRY